MYNLYKKIKQIKVVYGMFVIELFSEWDVCVLNCLFFILMAFAFLLNYLALHVGKFLLFFLLKKCRFHLKKVFIKLNFKLINFLIFKLTISYC